MSASRSWLLSAIAVGVVVGIVTVADLQVVETPAASPGTPTPAPTATATATPTPTATPEPTPTATPSPTATPYVGQVYRIRIPRFGVDSAIEPVGVDAANQMEVPHNPHNTGWYDPNQTGWGGNDFLPGWEGNAVFSAHVTYFPNIHGPFYNLWDLEDGDEITVLMDNGEEYSYEVFFKERYLVDEMPVGDLIWPDDRPDGEEWITLITCGGEYREFSPGGPGEYLHRDVVIARKVH